ncbi:MAG: polysaccharide deacetylase family protein, partial [Nonomuraea sp.]|nr:polysaccharide deacetylase family protein [Nonomuraea sp.]
MSGSRVPSSASLTRIIGITNIVVVVSAVIGLILLPASSAPAAKPLAAVRTPLASATGQPPVPVSTTPPGIDATPEFAKQVRANEAGLVPVLMYHRIIKKRVASIDRTPSQLKKELEGLAKDGYVPVTAREFATGAMPVPAGRFPVVLTFDDGQPSHFGLDAGGAPKKDTAVDIILRVAREYPSFRPVATFWINHKPFGLDRQEDQAAAVRWLVEHGFEVANHTWSHPDLSRMPKKKVSEQIVRIERLLKKLGAPQDKTLALPYGAMPHPRKVARKGSWDGTSYDFAGVFLAGAEPSASPFAKTFDPLAIQRIQSNGRKGECRKWCSEYWLGWLDKHPGWRYVSDGDPNRISVPVKLRGNIDPKRRPQVNA